MTDLNEVKVETAEAAEIPEIRRLAFAIWPDAYGAILGEAQIAYMLDLFYSEEALREQFQSHTFLLVKIATENVGFASFSKNPEGTYAKLHKLYVLPGLQGKGLGRNLLDTVIAEARLLKLDAVELNVNRHNKAITFYENYGFVKTREEDINIGNDYWMNDYVMRFELN